MRRKKDMLRLYTTLAFDPAKISDGIFHEHFFFGHWILASFRDI